MTTDPLIGQTLDGRYEIIEPIGKGSMGIVYRARQLSVDRDVAVKVINPETIPATLSTGAFERFQNEAKIVSNLRHPNTVKLHDFGKTEDGRLYLVMELLHGQPLDKLLEQGPLDEKRTLSILRQVADSLAEAHNNGIIHRDLKPANIFVDQVSGQEVVKVLDFGIAKVAAHPMQTATGAVIGTPAYMSPEQAQGEPIDAATDVYCLGILAYHCLSGGLPFESDTPVGILMKHVNEPPPPLSGIQISPATERLIMRMLSKDPKQRPATATEVQKALSDPDKQPAASEPRPAPRRRLLLGIAIAALAGLVAMGAILFVNLTKPLEKAPKPGATVAVTQLTEQPGFEGQPTISPDGKFVAYTSNAAGNNDIYLLRVGGDRPINLTADSKAHESWPAFSPDGEQIAFVSMRDPPGVYVMGATGESQRRLVDRAFNPCWSHDGKEIFFTTELLDFLEGPYSRNMTSTLWAVEVESGRRRQITKGDVMQPDASPNGHRIAFWAVHNVHRDIWTIGVDGKNPVAVTKDAPTDYNPVWSPSGEHLYFLSDRSGTMNLWRVPIDEKSGRVRGPLEQLTSGAANMYDLAISKSGLMAYNNQDKSFKIMRTEFDAGKEELTGSPVDVLETSSDVEWLDLSPDGKYLTYVSGPADDIVITGTDGKNRRFLTRDESFNRFPRFSPDGKSLAFYSNRGGRYEIWLVNMDGTGKRQLTNTKGDAVYHAWSPDGKRIAFMRIGDGMYVVDVPEDEPAENFTKLTDSSMPFGLVYPTSWSPDGRMLAGFFATTGGIPIAYTYSFGDKKIEKLADYSYLPTWLSDSKRLLSVTLVTGKLELIDHETKRRKELLQLPQGTVCTGLAVSADDSEIYFTTAHITADLWLLRVE
jgi:Tol biopolymer transport system component/tRNA A-37 threonylcarbamoyl transferase component Bud32